MATSSRGYKSARSSSTFGSYSGIHSGSGGSAWDRSDMSGSRSGGKSKSSGATGGPSPAYKRVSNSFQNKISSYRALINQTKGPAKYARPTPTVLNSFAGWINKGALIQTVSCAQVTRWAKSSNKTFSSRSPSPTACKTILWAKFGKSTIKAVARTKSGSFMVATSPTWKGRSFNFPR